MGLYIFENKGGKGLGISINYLTMENWMQTQSHKLQNGLISSM